MAESPSPQPLPDVCAALDVLDEAFTNLREVLERRQEDFRLVRKRVAKGWAVLDAVADIQPDQNRIELEEALRRFQEARQHVRVVTLTASQAQGTSNSVMAGIWGISRQRASQLVQRARSEEAGLPS
jgi:endonuclease V-like protein UPF0215 family